MENKWKNNNLLKRFNERTEGGMELEIESSGEYPIGIASYEGEPLIKMTCNPYSSEYYKISMEKYHGVSLDYIYDKVGRKEIRDVLDEFRKKLSLEYNLRCVYTEYLPEPLKSYKSN